MSLLSETELRRTEAKYATGITSAAVVKIFTGKGERFSEATLRKYVQLGLLPTSRRVGIRGRHRGSSGLYPAIIVRMANEIKRGLEAGATLDDLRFSSIGLRGEIQVMRRTVDQVLDRLGEVAQRRAQPAHRAALKQALARRRQSLDREIRGLEAFVGQLSKRVKQAK